MNFTAHTDKQRQEMLKDINISNIEELFTHIPVKLQNLNLAEPLDEIDAQKQVRSLAKQNNTDYVSFLGGGCYNKYIPAGISQVAQRFEFLTAYTPYQPEISQGTLKIMYDYQTMICKLTGMDVSNASVYDGGSACAEAISMACRITKKKQAVVSNRLNPEYKDVIKTYAWGNDIEIKWVDELDFDTSEYACVLIQNPDYYGEIKELPKTDTLLVVCTNLDSLSIIEPPRNADIVVGDVQTLGIPMSMGGPHAGFMACKEKYTRQLPGRLSGKTVDTDGNEAYTLTLQTREQHIRREKATSNICSNQALVALQATLYLNLVGEVGFKKIGKMCFEKSHRLAQNLKEIGIEIQTTNFFNEFVAKTDNSDEVLAELKSNNILGGIKLDDNRILVCVTEMISDDEIAKYTDCLKKFQKALTY